MFSLPSSSQQRLCLRTTTLRRPRFSLPEAIRAFGWPGRPTSSSRAEIPRRSRRIDGQSLRGNDVMKRTTPILGALVCFALVQPAVASESFILNIPVRGNANQETGEVRIALGFNAAPADAQL